MEPLKHTNAPFEIKSADDGSESEIVTKALADFQSAVDDRLKALETKSANDNAVADRLKAIEVRLNRPGAGVDLKSANENGEIERKAFVNYLRAGKEGMGADEVKSLTLGTSASAGYLAPPQFAGEILKYIVLFSPIRAYAGKVQISGSEVIYPRRDSILNASWVAETDPRAASTTAFEQVTMKPYELATYVDISNQLLEDNAYDLEGEIALQFGQAFGKAEGAAFVSGSGTGQPTGLLTSTQVASMQSGNTASVELIDLIQMFHAVPTAWAQSAVWLMNRATMGILRAITDTIGRPLLMDAPTAGAPATIFGRPIVEAPDMPNVASGATPILFGDLGGYRIVDRVGFTSLRDPYSQAATGYTRFYGRKRVGGDVVDGQRFIKLAVK